MLELSSSMYTSNEGDGFISIIIIITGVTLVDTDVVINLADGSALGKRRYTCSI